MGNIKREYSVHTIKNEAGWEWVGSFLYLSFVVVELDLLLA